MIFIAWFSEDSRRQANGAQDSGLSHRNSFLAGSDIPEKPLLDARGTAATYVGSLSEWVTDLSESRPLSVDGATASFPCYNLSCTCYRQIGRLTATPRSDIPPERTLLFWDQHVSD